jgi:formate dehydrogenase subunit delta
MDIDKLIKMANQIGDFFESIPDRKEASDGIANHLKRFWAPRMRTQLLDHIDNLAGIGLKPIVLASIQAHRAELKPVTDTASHA